MGRVLSVYPEPMPIVLLNCHSSSPCAAVRSIEVSVEGAGPDTLSLRYVARGAMAGLRLPSGSAGQRMDGLWRHTCFEAFLRRVGQSGYCEWNYSPAGSWAAYRFDGYRDGMSPLEITDAPRTAVRLEADELAFAVTLSLRMPASAEPSSVLELALSAVIEERSGRLSYWALRHAPGQPDFHHAQSYGLALRPSAADGFSITRI